MLGQSIQVDNLDCDSEDGAAYGKNRMASSTMGLGAGNMYDNNANGSSPYGRKTFSGAVKKGKAGRSRDRPVSMNLANLPRNMG